MPGTGPRPPRLGGRYVAVRLLGKGAQARVYLAFDQRERRWVAAKVLDRKYLKDREVRQRFLNEAQTMQRLKHPFILRVLDVGDDGPIPWIILELARGGAVTQWVRRNGPMPPALAAEVTLQAARGLHHAHQAGVIHRDVKPHNLLIAEAERVVVTDFGVAQAADASMTATGTVMGTFAYMAPEQRHDAKAVDVRADVYSLSVTLYSLITGKPSAELFYAEADDDIMRSIPEVLRPVLIKGAAYRREDRHRDMEAFARELHGARQHLGAELPRLDDEWLALAAGPPERLADGALEDLRDEMGLDDEQPTYVPSSGVALDQLYEGQQTVLQHSSSAGEGYEDAATVHIRPGDSQSGFVDYASEEASTMRPAPSMPHGANISQPVATIDDAPSMLGSVLTASAIGIALAATIWLGAVGTNLAAGWSLERAESDLAATIATAETALVPLREAGIDPAPLLADFERYQQSGDTRDALAFAEALSTVATDGAIDDLSRSRVEPLLQAADRYRQAETSLAAQRRSVMGRLSLGVGL